MAFRIKRREKLEKTSSVGVLGEFSLGSLRFDVWMPKKRHAKIFVGRYFWLFLNDFILKKISGVARCGML